MIDIIILLIAAFIFMCCILPHADNAIHRTPKQLAVAKKRMQEMCDRDKGKDHPLL
jgi:hypothetical protein